MMSTCPMETYPTERDCKRQEDEQACGNRRSNLKAGNLNLSYFFFFFFYSSKDCAQNIVVHY